MNRLQFRPAASDDLEAIWDYVVVRILSGARDIPPLF